MFIKIIMLYFCERVSEIQQTNVISSTLLRSVLHNRKLTVWSRLISFCLAIPFFCISHCFVFLPFIIFFSVSAFSSDLGYVLCPPPRQQTVCKCSNLEQSMSLCDWLNSAAVFTIDYSLPSPNLQVLCVACFPFIPHTLAVEISSAHCLPLLYVTVCSFLGCFLILLLSEYFFSVIL